MDQKTIKPDPDEGGNKKLPPNTGRLNGGSVIPAAVKTPGNKLVRIIMPGINMVAVKKPEKKFAKIDSDISKE